MVQDPANADAFWSTRYAERDYTETGRDYAYYRPAYRMGHQWALSRGGSFEDAEPDMKKEWRELESDLSWDNARPAIRDAFHHASNTEHSTPGNPLA